MNRKLAHPSSVSVILLFIFSGWISIESNWRNRACRWYIAAPIVNEKNIYIPISSAAISLDSTNMKRKRERERVRVRVSFRLQAVPPFSQFVLLEKRGRKLVCRWAWLRWVPVWKKDNNSCCLYVTSPSNPNSTHSFKRSKKAKERKKERNFKVNFAFRLSSESQ